MLKASWAALVISTTTERTLDVFAWAYPEQREDESPLDFYNACDRKRDDLLRCWMKRRGHDPADFSYYRISIQRIKDPSEV